MQRFVMAVLFLSVMVLLASCYPPTIATEKSEPAPGRAAKQDHTMLIPLVQADGLSHRAGFAGLPKSPEATTATKATRAGWYYSWWVNANPYRADGMEYVQLINLHQKLTCPLRSTNAHDRNKCPYAEPLDYVLSQDRGTIAAAVRKNPASLWLIGNEMDIRDTPGGGQNETLPETYAVAYHDLYSLIKSNDPSAKVAIGGVVQPSPLRLEYLTKVWDAYQAKYGMPMPVDVWNVHNYILDEVVGAAGVPPGSSAAQGTIYTAEISSAHVNMAIFDRQIRAMRAWMRDRGQQNKSLIVSEYGVLYPRIPEADTPEEVRNFLATTSDYFLNTKDCSLGDPSDECRLVQRWAWFSFDSSCCNLLGRLFDPDKKGLSLVGERFKVCAETEIMDREMRQMGLASDDRWVGCRETVAARQ